MPVGKGNLPRPFRNIRDCLWTEATIRDPELHYDSQVRMSGIGGQLKDEDVWVIWQDIQWNHGHMQFFP